LRVLKFIQKEKMKVHTWITKYGTKVIRLNNFRCNCYFIVKENNAILVDTSIRAERSIIEKAMKKVGIDKPVVIVLTHNHFDHAGNVEFFRRKYNCDVIIHEKDYEGLRKGYTDLPDGINQPFKSATRFINSRKIILPFQKFPPCPKAIPVSDGVILKKYGINARILSTPGHTDGSISIIVDEEIALVGDCMVRSVNGEIFPPFAKHPDEVTRSWIKLINTGCRFFLPAHGNENSSEYVRKKMKKQLNTIMLKRIK